MQTLLFIVASINLFLVISAEINSKTAHYVSEDDVPEVCRNQTYCTVKPRNYPQEKFNNMFKDKKVLVAPGPVKETTFLSRIGDPTEIDNCESEVTYDPLYMVRENKSSPWRKVIQAPDVDYVQHVRLETCLNENANCFTPYDPVKYFVTFCKQQSLTWLVLVEKQGGGSEKIKAELPVCCSCHYKEV